MCLHVLLIGVSILTVEICSAVILSVQRQKVTRSLQQEKCCEYFGRSKKCGNKLNRRTGQQEPTVVVVFKKCGNNVNK